MKKTLAFILALTLSCSLTTGAFADDGLPEGPSGPTRAVSSADLTDFGAVTQKDAVSMLVKLGLVSGIPQAGGTYKYAPADKLSRAAGAALIAPALNIANGREIPEPTAVSFSDTDMWAKTYIEYCVSNGVIKNTGGAFNPNGELTRQEFAAWLEAAGGKGDLFEGVTPGDTLSRDDAARMLLNALTGSDGTSALPKLTIISETTALTGLNVPQNSVIAAPEGKQVTLTVDGVQHNIENKNYSGDIKLSVTDDYVVSSMGNDYYLSAAAYINGGLVAGRSVSSAVISGEIGADSAEAVVIDSRGDNFNGIIVDGDTKYTIKDAVITLNGHGGDDFAGYGAGIMTTGNANVVIDNAKIDTTGAIRTGIWAGGNSTLLVKDSVVTGRDGDNVDFKAGMMNEVPWVLGLFGNLRSTNVLGSAKVTYLNSSVTAEQWGALSTDSTSPGSSLTAVNTDIVISGDSGYGSYADIVVQNYYYGSRFKVPSQGLIVASGDCGATFGKSSEENVGAEIYAMIPEDARDDATVVDSGRIGVLWHKNQNGVVSIKEGTVFNCGDTVFLVKSDIPNPAYPVLEVDSSELNSKAGVILHLMESDDAGMGGGPPGSPEMWAKDYTVPEVAPVKDGNDTTAVNDSTMRATFSNMEMTGDIYNSRWTAGQNLSVTLDNATITGLITAGTQFHKNVAPGGKIVRENRGELSNVSVTPSEVVSNGVIVELKNSAVWNPTGTAYLSRLTIGDGCTVAGDMTVDGKAVVPEAGKTYTGNIVVTAK